jgi:N-acetylneuraminate synthase
LYIEIGGRKVGPDYPPFLVAEMGINYATDNDQSCMDNVLQMMFLARQSGAEAVKFQKRTPHICVPADQWDKRRETPWGERSYIEYKEDIELNKKDYDRIAAYAEELGLLWFASVWDELSVDFMEQYDRPCYKIGSASLTDHALLRAVRAKERPIILSTGMSTLEEIEDAVEVLGSESLILCHSTSIYPCPKDKLNLRFIRGLQELYPAYVVGYSGHEQGTEVTSATVALGASYVERHFTLGRRGWGTDQAASIEHWQFKTMADQCHAVWSALGSGVKTIYPEEEEKKVTLRRESIAAD